MSSRGMKRCYYETLECQKGATGLSQANPVLIPSPSQIPTRRNSHPMSPNPNPSTKPGTSK